MTCDDSLSNDDNNVSVLSGVVDAKKVTFCDYKLLVVNILNE